MQVTVTAPQASEVADSDVQVRIPSQFGGSRRHPEPLQAPRRTTARRGPTRPGPAGRPDPGGLQWQRRGPGQPARPLECP